MHYIQNILTLVTDSTNSELFFQILFYLFLTAFGLQLLYYLGIYLPTIFFKNKSDNSSKEPVSIIICAKNEYENLKKYLPIILEQEYPEYEVIIVNDASIDETEEFLAQLKQKYNHLKFTSLPEDQNFNHGKKLALSIGIKAAKYENLLLTDADCWPKSKKWIDTMQQDFRNKEIILGYGGYQTKRGLLNKIIRYDTLTIAMQYFSLAKLGIPYMGVGRNLAYKKSLFFNNKGFGPYSHILSGDDDLFINHVANKNNTTICFNQEAHTLSEPKYSLKDWNTQKKRHLSTGKYYKFKHKFILALEPFSKLLFYLSFVLLLSIHYNIELIVSLFLFKILVQHLIIKLYMKKFEERGFLLFTLIFDFFIPLFNIYLLSASYISSKNNKWK